MSALNDERVDLAGKLAAAGVVGVTLDPRAVAPFTLLGPPTVVAAQGVGGWAVDYPVVIVVPPPGSGAALVALLDQVELVVRTLGAVAAVPTVYGDTEAPAYELAYRRNITNPDC